MNRARVLCKLIGREDQHTFDYVLGRCKPSDEECSAERILRMAEGLQQTYFRAVYAHRGVLAYQFDSLCDDEALAWCAVARRFNVVEAEASRLFPPKTWDEAPRCEVHEIHIQPQPLTALQHIDIARGMIKAMEKKRYTSLAITRLDEAVHWLRHVD